jgi:phosphinothricin acetyltransferase
MANVIFKEVKDENLTEILKIYTYYVKNTTATFHTNPLSLADMKRIVILENDRYKTFVICENESICGYVILTQYNKREAFDDTAEVTIYLNPDFVGKGVGSFAAEFIEEYAKKKDFHVLVALITGDNLKSITLFERSGYFKCAHYKEVGKKFGQLLDLVVYQKIIS